MISDKEKQIASNLLMIYIAEITSLKKNPIREVFTLMDHLKNFSIRYGLPAPEEEFLRHKKIETDLCNYL